ncbi:hypothetical protein B0H14DRAFT_2562828 [Mycena olivaceomarginata]|nr:hypothetical protein B0H14DRAFT_2562828 [Mycena olivaceomarginata]
MSLSKQSPKVSTTDVSYRSIKLRAHADPSEAEAAQDLILENIIGKIDVLSSRMRACWADSLPDLYRRKTAYILDIPERMLRRLGLSVTESVYAARIGADSPPDQYPTQTSSINDVPERFYKRFGPPIAERVHAIHVGDASHRISLRHENHWY